MATSKQDHAWAIRQVPLFQRLDEDSVETLLANFRYRLLPRGQALFEEEDEGSSLYVILSGRVRVEKGFGDEMRIVAELGAGEIFGEIALLEGGPRSATVRVTDDARLLELPRDSFVRCIRRSPEFALRILASLTHRLREFTDETVQQAQRPVLSRLAALLVENAGAEGVTPRLTNGEIAHRINTTRETVNRSLRRLEADGAIDRPDGQPKRYRIRDIQHLQRLAARH